MRNIPHKVTGDDLTADEFDDIPEEEENLITSTGQTLTAADLHQIAKAVSIYVAVGDFYVDSGSANHYVLTAVSPLQAPIQYADGFRVRFRISHTNTGASDINVNGLGIKNIVKEDGITPTGAGDLPIGEHGELIFHADIDAFELYSHKYQDNIFTTGDNLWSDSSADRPGWIRVNDSTLTTIGDASSAATIRANADCEQLFLLYWTFANTECPVTGGRGISAAADWAAHKKIAIPNAFLRVFAAFDISNAYSLRNGEVEGERTHTLITSEIPSHTHPTTIVSDSAPRNTGDGGSYDATASTTTGSTGGDGAHNNIQPTIYKTLYIKL